MQKIAIALICCGVMVLPAHGVAAEGPKTASMSETTQKIKEVRKQAEAGDARAQYLVGTAYETGYGVAKDHRLAADWYGRAATQGHGLAMYRLGRLYENGTGVPQSILHASNWYLRAAKKGDAKAQIALGKFLEHGIGGPKNLKQAEKLYAMAAAQGNAEAKVLMNRLKKGQSASDGEQIARKVEPNKWPKPGKTIRYKGKTLIGSTYTKINNQAFFDTMKIAINMTESLPPKYRAYVDKIKEVRYDPPSPERVTKGAITTVPAVYSIGNDFDKRAPMIVYEDMKYSAPYYLAMDLVGNGILAGDHARMIELRRQFRKNKSNKTRAWVNQQDKLKKEYRELEAALDKSDSKVVLKKRCQRMNARMEVMKIWKIDSRERDGLARSMSNKGCWDLLKG